MCISINLDISKISEKEKKYEIEKLRAGDTVLLSGSIYTARDAAHKKIVEMIRSGERLPFEIKGSVIYYVGPTPAKDEQKIGSAGPTTSYRMDSYAPTLIDCGNLAMIGKGNRNEKVVAAIKRNKAVYFAAIGGAADLIAKTVENSEVIAFPELGAEAIRKIYVNKMPLIVAIDSQGNNLYETGPAQYLEG